MDVSTDSGGVGHVTLVAQEPRVGKVLLITGASRSHTHTDTPHALGLP